MDSIATFEEKLRRKGFDIFTADYHDQNKIIENTTLIIPDCMMHDKIGHFRFPIDLTGRSIGLAKSFEFTKISSLKIIAALVSYKFAFKKANGYTHTIKTKKVNYIDLTHQLFEATQFRGSVMPDINIRENPVWVVIRFQDLPT